VAGETFQTSKVSQQVREMVINYLFEKQEKIKSIFANRERFKTIDEYKLDLAEAIKVENYELAASLKKIIDISKYED